jgi:hypothetical protein
MRVPFWKEKIEVTFEDTEVAVALGAVTKEPPKS